MQHVTIVSVAAKQSLSVEGSSLEKERGIGGSKSGSLGEGQAEPAEFLGKVKAKGL